MTVLKVVLSDSESVRFMCHIDFFKNGSLIHNANQFENFGSVLFSQFSNIRYCVIKC